MKNVKSDSWLFNIRTFSLLFIIVVLCGYIVVLKSELNKKDLAYSLLDSKCINKNINKK